MLYQQIAHNKRKTVLVLFIFFLILALAGAGIGYLIANAPLAGTIVTIVIALIYLLIVLANPASLVMSLNHAREVHEKDNPELWHVVEDMAMVAQVPMPHVYIINDPSPNAFATGRDPKNASVAVTQGLLDMMNREELEGVIGHEISHVRNYDILISTIALVLVAVISFIANWGGHIIWWGADDSDSDEAGWIVIAIRIALTIFTVILAPIAATLAQLALSRNREYLADASSVKLTRNPQGLISALEKISHAQPMKKADPSSSGLYIANPFGSKKSWHNLWDTHPATSDRIARLKNM